MVRSSTVALWMKYGPMHVATMSRDLHPICENFIRAGEELQIPRNPDLNGNALEGLGYYQNTAKDGMRITTARAYIRPIGSRPNLLIEKGAQSTKVLFEQGALRGKARRRSRV